MKKNYLRVCERCLEAIESREGKQCSFLDYVDEENPDESRCEWCGENSFDALYEIRGNETMVYDFMRYRYEEETKAIHRSYAEIAWGIEDIQLFRDDWTDEQCAEWWEENEKWFTNALIEHGNSLICSKL